MKLFIVTCFLLLIVVVVYGRPEEKHKPQNKYSTKYDNVNIDDIIKSDRLLNNYVNCLLEKGKCSPDAFELKKNLPDALLTNCSKCSEKQKVNSEKVIDFLIENKHNLWSELEAKYDKKGEYKKKYDARLKKENPKM